MNVWYSFLAGNRFATTMRTSTQKNEGVLVERLVEKQIRYGFPRIALPKNLYPLPLSVLNGSTITSSLIVLKARSHFSRGCVRAKGREDWPALYRKW